MVPHASSIYTIHLYTWAWDHLGMYLIISVDPPSHAMSSGEVKPLGPFQLHHVSTLISRIFLMTWVCSPPLCKCAASWVASLANPVIAIWVSPGEPEDVLNFSSSRHISSYLVHLWGLRLRSICHRLIQDVSWSLKHSSTVLKLVAFAKWFVKAFFFWFTPSFATKSDLCEILWNRFRLSQFYYILTPLMLVSSTQIYHLNSASIGCAERCGKRWASPPHPSTWRWAPWGQAVIFPARNRHFWWGSPIADHVWLPEGPGWDSGIPNLESSRWLAWHLPGDRQVNKDPFWMVTHVLFA